MRLLFLDIETTGFKKTFHQILEIAAILYDTDKDEPLDKFHEYIKPKDPIENDFVHGITNEIVANCRIEVDVLRDFVNQRGPQAQRDRDGQLFQDQVDNRYY